MALQQDLAILNANDKCNGKLTRISGQEKSILDYAIVLQNDEYYVKSIQIDEEKIDTPKYNKEGETIYTDHGAMIIEINWTDANIDNTKNNSNIAITRKSLEAFYKATNGTTLTKIANKKECITKKYNEWQKEVTKKIKTTFSITKNKYAKTMKSVRKLNQLKKYIRTKNA